MIGKAIIDRAHILRRMLRRGADGSIRDVAVGVFVMSHDSYREVLRYDVGGFYSSYSYDRTKPCTLMGVRVAYDDSMPLGEVQGAEVLP